jgi:peptidoglycan biosynthesis protein MviN/MurJ (putative lipid II flippase)
LTRVLLASGIMGVVVWWLAGDLQRWLDMHTGQRVTQTALCVLVGVGVYFMALFAAGTRLADLRH